MKRIAFTLQLKPGCEDEYKRRHDAIWPDLRSALQEAGVSNYTIFLESSTGRLFAVQDLSDSHTVELLKDNPVVRKWWDYMSELMVTQTDNEPVTHPLKKMFHLP